MSDEERRAPHAGQIATGVMLMVLGSVFLVQRAGLLSLAAVWQWWPSLLIVIGVVNLVAPRTGKGRGSGLWLLLLGTWLLLDTLRVISIHDSWPVLLVAAGASIAWQAIRPGRTSEGHHAD